MKSILLVLLFVSLAFSTKYYVDPAAAGSGTVGTSWDSAFTTMQSACASPVAAGDTVYLRGTQTLVGANAAIVPGVAGTNSAYIRYIGCNASGINDGTKFIINCNTGGDKSTYGINFSSSKGYIYFENIGITLASSHGLVLSGTGCEFKNCSFYSNGGSGFTTGDGNGVGVIMLGCLSYSNSGAGYIFSEYITNGMMIGCCAYSNGANGFQLNYNGTLFYCLAYSNVGHGISLAGSNNSFQLFGCVSYGNTGANGNGLSIAASSRIFASNNRFCGNAQYGINGGSGSAFAGGRNVVVGNTAGQIHSNVNKTLSMMADVVTGSDGMINASGGNFMTAKPITDKIIGVAIDATNTNYFIAGLPPMPDFPLAENVFTVDSVDGVPGTGTQPAAGNLKLGVQCGIGGTGVTGTRTDADTANVIAGSGTYGAGGTEFTPTNARLYTAADETNRNVGVAAGKILTGNSIKIANTTTNGSLTLPDENYVDATKAAYGDPAAAKTPTLITPAENTVKSGTEYGPTSGALTGSFVGTDTCGGGGSSRRAKGSFKNY